MLYIYPIYHIFSELPLDVEILVSGCNNYLHEV